MCSAAVYKKRTLILYHKLQVREKKLAVKMAEISYMDTDAMAARAALVV